jgi:type I restriction enzyme S subunit
MTNSSAVAYGWKAYELGALASKIEGGGTPPRDEPAFWNGGIPWATVKDLKGIRLRTTQEYISKLGLQSSSSKLVPANTLILASRMAVGKVVFFDKDVAINQDLKAFYPKSILDFQYLLQWYLSKAEYIAGLGTGSTVKGIKLDDLNTLPIDLPPLPEQQKIAAILTSVDEVIEKTQAQIDKLKDLKTAMMQTLLSPREDSSQGNGVGTKQASADAALNNRTACRESYIPHTEFKDSPVGRIPKSWEVSKLGELFHVQLGKMLSKASKVGDSPCSYLGNKNVQWGKVDLSNLERMDFKDAERKKFSLIKGDLLICEGGDVGRTAIWQGEMTNCYYQKAIHRLRPISSRFEPFLLMEYMRFSKETGLLVDFISQTSIAHLTKEKLISIPLPVPPMEEQKMIVSILKSIAEKIEIRSKKLQKNKELKKALMQDLLTGKVRVKLEASR